MLFEREGKASPEGTGRTLHVGLTLSQEQERNPSITHCPLIAIQPRPFNLPPLKPISHVIFTSKTAVRRWIDKAGANSLQGKTLLSVGKGTTAVLKSYGLSVHHTAKNECAEGMVELIATLPLSSPRFLWPHAAGARRAISDFCQSQQIPLEEVVLYDTVQRVPSPLPNLDEFDTVFFSSPSSVAAFFNLFPTPPSRLKFECIGPVTQSALIANAGKSSD